jgi:hypothetical protein
MRTTAAFVTLLAVACSGDPSVPVAPVVPVVPVVPVAPVDEAVAEVQADWVESAVSEALGWEVMPGTTGEDDDGTRAAALRTFFQAHPEYRDPDRRALLAAEACGLGGTEQAHAWLANPPAPKALDVEVTSPDWAIFVAHADQNCTSDDWSYYSTEVGEAAAARGAGNHYAGAGTNAVVVRMAGSELIRIPLQGQGFLVARAGAEPQDLAYAPTPELLPALDLAFGPPRAEP